MLIIVVISYVSCSQNYIVKCTTLAIIAVNCAFGFAACQAKGCHKTITRETSLKSLGYSSRVTPVPQPATVSLNVMPNPDFVPNSFILKMHATNKV